MTCVPSCAVSALPSRQSGTSTQVVGNPGLRHLHQSAHHGEGNGFEPVAFAQVLDHLHPEQRRHLRISQGTMENAFGVQTPVAHQGFQLVVGRLGMLPLVAAAGQISISSQSVDVAECGGPRRLVYG